MPHLPLEFLSNDKRPRKATVDCRHHWQVIGVTITPLLYPSVKSQYPFTPRGLERQPYDISDEITIKSARLGFYIH